MCYIKRVPPRVPLRSRARARARALVPLACHATPRHAAPRRAASSPPRPPPYVSNPSRTYDATRPMYNATQKSALPACLLALCLLLSRCLRSASLERIALSWVEYTRWDHGDAFLGEAMLGNGFNPRVRE